jgi:rsbT co-antagonist protein RsbR
MVSFAGYPLVVDDRLVGVMAMFARRPLSDAVLQALGAVSREVGLGVVRKRTEEERNRLQREVIEAQQSLLAELSTPLIPIREGVVVMPLIGAMNAERAGQMLHALLKGVTQSGARVAIVDVTGVRTVDTQVADTLMRAAQSVRLLGAEVVITGIRAGVAQILVQLGADLRDVATRRNLQEGIEFAGQIIGAHLR